MRWYHIQTHNPKKRRMHNIQHVTTEAQSQTIEIEINETQFELIARDLCDALLHMQQSSHDIKAYFSLTNLFQSSEL